MICCQGDIRGNTAHEQCNFIRTEEEEISSSVSYKSCHRTEADEEFLMVRSLFIVIVVSSFRKLVS